MKTLNFLLVITIVGGLLLSCDKSDDKPSDNIVFTEINKTITLSNPDSISGACKDLIFEIKEVSPTEKTVAIRLNDVFVLCDV